MKKIVAIMMAMIMVISVTVVLAGGADKDTQQSKVPVIIGFEGTPSQADKKAIVRGHGGEIKHSYTIIDAIAAKLPEPAIENIRKNPNVAYVEMDGEVHAHDELDASWGVERIGAGNVHDGGNTGADVKVAILDTGIDYNHPDLDDNFDTALLGYDFVNDDADPKDDNGHGTHCAGIVAAEDNEEGVVGVAPGADLYAVKVLDSGGSGYVSDAVAGIQWSIENGTQVISMSFGGGFYSESMEAACDAADAAGIVVVASAGNSGNPPARGDNVDYPARYDSVIAVAATDSNDIRARWSSTGPDVELAAPGVGIYSTYLGGGYATKSGTSMAGPHVAGTAALAIASYKSNVRQYLQDTADDLGATGEDNLYGYGLVDADEDVPPAPNTPPEANAGGPYTGTEDVAITFDGSGSGDSDDDTLTYAWDFGDGSTGTSVNPTNIYTAGGFYTVTLVVNDGKEYSEQSDTTATITEVNDPPVADAGSDQNVVVGEVVTFDGSKSYDLDGTITDYAWEFGDGSTGTGMTTTHTYGTAEVYAVKLTVTDNGTLTGNDTAIVTVVTEAPANAMHIGSIVMSTDSKTRGRNTFVWGVATVTIVDADEKPVDGATVYGTWSGLTSDDDLGQTGSDGTVALNSDSVKNAAGTFTFTVTDVEHSLLTYDPSKNVETSNSTTAG